MESETTEKREAREAELRRLCEALGLTVAGSLVTARLDAKCVSVDASAIDHSRLVAALIYQAHQQGIELGREMVHVYS